MTRRESRWQSSIRAVGIALMAVACGSESVTGVSEEERLAAGKGKPGGGGAPADPVIAYSVERTRDLVVVNVDGAAAAALTSVDVFGTVAWSPTGPQLVFGGEDRNGFGMFTVDVLVSGGSASFANFRRLLDGNQWGGPEWSPDGTRIVYRAVIPGEQVNGLFVVLAAGGTPVLLHALGSGEHPISIVWSPDGARIGAIVHESMNYDDTRLDLIDAGSGNLLASRRLPENARFAEWARDGAIWFSGFPTGENPEQVMRLAPDLGGDPQVMFAGTAPTVSPDGQQVAYQDTRGALLVRNLTTGSVSSVAKGAHAPDWR